MCGVSSAQWRLVFLLFLTLRDEDCAVLSWNLNDGRLRRLGLVTTGDIYKMFSKCLANPEKLTFGAELLTSPPARLQPEFKLCSWKNGDHYDISNTTRCNKNLTQTSMGTYLGQLWFPATHESQAHEVQLIHEWDWTGIPKESFRVRKMSHMPSEECRRRYINTVRRSMREYLVVCMCI